MSGQSPSAKLVGKVPQQNRCGKNLTTPLSELSMISILTASCRMPFR